MALFDFLKPKWKRSSPAARIAGIAQLQDEATLLGIAGNDPDESVRSAALGRLDEVRPKWQHSQPKVRLAAVSELRDQKLLKKLARDDPDESVKASALRRLDEVGPKWQHSQPEMRQRGIADLADESTLSTLAKSDPDESVRAAAIDRLDAVWRLKEERTDRNARWDICQQRAKGLIQDLQSKKPEIRLVTARLFGKLGVRATGHPMQALATLAAADPNESVRKAASDAVILILSSVLTDDYPAPGGLGDIRRSAAQALQNVIDPRVVEPLIKVVSQDNVNRYTLSDAIVALGNQRDKRAVEPLRRIISRPDHYSPGTDVDAARALVKIGEAESIRYAASKGLLYGDPEVDSLIEETVSAWVHGDRQKFDASFTKVRALPDEGKVVLLLHMRFDCARSRSARGVSQPETVSFVRV